MSEIKTFQTTTSEVDLDKRALDAMCINESQLNHPFWYNFKYTAVGLVFGFAFIKAEIVSWYRIQEMFRFQSFHMYGIIGTGVVLGALFVWLIKRFNIKTIHGETVLFHPKQFSWGQVIGGTLFGFGWAMTGACPGPLFALIGSGAFAIGIVILSAVVGTWVYGYFRDSLPH